MKVRGIRGAMLAVGIAVSAGAPGGWAQDKPQRPARPVFGTDVNVVAVDVSVVDGEGRPVRDLPPEAFSITVDGAPRQVLSADFIALGSDEAAAPVAVPSPPAGFSTNENVRRGRTIIILVDQGNIRPGAGRHVLRAIDQLLDRLAPSDLVALITIPGGGPQVELTTDHDLLRKAIKGVVGRAHLSGPHVSLTEALAYNDGRSFAWDGVIERECPSSMSDNERRMCISDVESEADFLAMGFRHDSEVSMKSLHALMENLARIEGPKTVLLVTEALKSERPDDLRQLSTEAAAARVALFTVYVDELGGPDASASQGVAPEDADTVSRDLYRLGSLTRGAVFRTTTGGGVFERIAREISGYYLLGFAPQGADQDGKEHVIQVKVARPGTTVRARRSLPLVVAGGAASGRAAISTILGSPLPAVDLPLRVATFVMKDADATSKVRILVAAEVGRGGLSPAGLTVGFVVVDSHGKMVGSGLQDGAAKGPPAGTNAGPLPFLGAVSVEPGKYTLKLAAVDGRGRRGSVEHPLTAALTTAGPFSLSDLLLAPPAETAGQALQPAVEVQVASGILAGYFELFGPEAAVRETTVKLDAARTEMGPTLVEAPAATADRGPGHRVAQGLLPVSLLPPGGYVARATVLQAGRPVGQVTRPFTVTAAAASGPAAAGPLAGFVPESARFDRAALLATDVLAPILQDLRRAAAAEGPLSPAVVRALDQAGAGRLADVVDTLGEGARDTLALQFLRGLGMLARNQLPGATTQFRLALRAHPDFVPTALYVGATAAAGGQDREAVGAWTTALLQGARTPALPLATADALVRLGQPLDAVDVLREAAAEWPDDPRFADHLALAYALAGRTTEALPLLEHRVQRAPDDVDARFALVRLLYEPLRTGAAATDREAFVRHARAYVAAKSPQSALVAEWLRAVEEAR